MLMGWMGWGCKGFIKVHKSQQKFIRDPLIPRFRGDIEKPTGTPTGGRSSHRLPRDRCNQHSKAHRCEPLRSLRK